MGVGRPSKYDPAYCDRVIELGREGASVVEMASTIGVARTTLERLWPAEHPEFMQALVLAIECAQTWWETTGRAGMLSKGIDSSIWSRSMAARFPKDWREKIGHVGGDETDEPIRTVIRNVIDHAQEG